MSNGYCLDCGTGLDFEEQEFNEGFCDECTLEATEPDGWEISDEILFAEDVVSNA